jgi:hypothetical protein
MKRTHLRIGHRIGFHMVRVPQSCTTKKKPPQKLKPWKIRFHNFTVP